MSPARSTATARPPSARGVERARTGGRERYEAEVELLVRAAFAVIRRTGSASPRVADVLAEAGLSTTAFYRHFPTKDALLVTLLERAHERTRAQIERAVAAVPPDEQDPAARVDAWIRALFAMAATPRSLMANRPFLLAHPRLLESYPDEVTAGIDQLVAGLAAVLAGAGVEDDRAEATARLTYHLVFGLLVDRAALARPVDEPTVEAVITHTRRAAGL